MGGRESIGSRFGFIMLAAGCAIGLGNIWRFPFVAGANGGALFVLLYVVFLILLGLPVMMMELAVGRAAQRGLYGAFRDLPEKRPSRWRFAGGAMLSGNLVLMIMYTTVTGWLLSYFCDFLTGRACNLATPEALAGHFGDLLASPGRMSFFMLLTTSMGFVVGICGLRRGVERVTKILMSSLFVLLLGLSIHALTLPGAKSGICFYLMPNVKNISVGNFAAAVSGAMTQAFFTLSLGVGAMTIFGSYIGKRHSLASESLLIIGCDTLVALLAGVVIFSACFSYGITVDRGPSLLLISLAGVFNHLPAGRFWGAVFFLFLSIAALTTVIAVFENLVAFMIDEWRMDRRLAAVINFIAVSTLSFPCLLGYNALRNVHPLGGKSTILDFEDWLLSDMYLPLGALALVVFCCWRGWTWKKFLAEINTGEGLKVPAWTKWYMKFILPLLILALFALGFYNRFFAGCSGEKSLLFDEYGNDSFHVVTTETTVSPSGAFAAEYSTDDPDTSGKYRLKVSHKSSGRSVLLGRGTRGAAYRWWETQLGDVLTVEYQENTHFSRVFVLYPHITADGSFKCRILYATPPLEEFPGGIPPEHIYPQIESVSTDGVLMLSLMWDYGPARGVKKTLEIPLFYGIPVAKQ